MNIIKAGKNDIVQILEITRSCARAMIQNEIYQWNESYPSNEVLMNDIELGQIWKLENKQSIIGVMVLTEIEDDEYKDVKWLTKNGSSIYVHRLAVHPDFQGQGCAQLLMTYAENYALEHNYKSIRLDTFSQNKRNQRFYKKRNFTELGTIFFPNQSEHPFICFEKVLNV